MLNPFANLARETIERLAREKGQLEVALLEARAEVAALRAELAELRDLKPITSRPVALDSEAWR